MKIVYLHQYFKTPEMSGGTRSYEMARRLVWDGHEVHVITSDRTGGARREEIIDGINVSWIPVRYSNKMGVLRRIWAFTVFAVLATVVGLKTRPTLVFATSTPLTIVFPALVTKWVRRVPMVFEVRDPWPEMLIDMGVLTNPLLIGCTKLLQRFAYRNSRHIVALSEGMKQTIVEAGYEEERITVIPNSRDNDRFSIDSESGQEIRDRYSWLGQRKMVLYAGTIGYANGVGYLVEVAKQLKALDSEVRFVVVGTGSEESKVRSMAEAAGILNQTFFMLPPVPKEDVPALFSAASISTVLLRDVPMLWTNSSNKFFDALAAGRPVAVNNTGWQRELLEESNAGIWLHPTDFSAAAEQLFTTLQDEEWLADACRNARYLAESRFDRDLLYEMFERVLIDAVESDREDRR